MKDFKFSKKSIEKLLTCHPDLVMIINYALKTSPLDFSVLCGHRGEKEQNRAYIDGNSKLKYPLSNHNKNPSNAVDIAPYPIDWNNIERFEILGRHVKNVANKLNIEIEWGGDWNFKDYPHFELK